MKTLQPTGTKVIISADVPEEKTASGIFYAEEVKEMPNTGMVRFIGDDVLAVKVGQRVVFPRYAAMELGKEDNLVTIEEDLIVAVIEDLVGDTDAS